MDAMPGDIFMTRNPNEADNTSPGHWNHLGVLVPGRDVNMVVEAQADPGVVQCVRIDKFCERYSEIKLIRLQRADGYRIAAQAQSMVGLRYRMLASIFKFMRRDRRGHNCVSVARKSAWAGLGFDPKWQIPDDADDMAHWLVWSRP